MQIQIRAAMARAGISNARLADALGDRGPSYISAILLGKTSPRLSECYRIMDVLGIPREEFTRCWPDDPFARADAYMDPSAPRKASGRNR